VAGLEEPPDLVPPLILRTLAPLRDSPQCFEFVVRHTSQQGARPPRSLNAPEGETAETAAGGRAPTSSCASPRERASALCPLAGGQPCGGGSEPSPQSLSGTDGGTTAREGVASRRRLDQPRWNVERNR